MFLLSQLKHHAVIPAPTARKGKVGKERRGSALRFTTVLVSARTELIFFLVAGTVLCFGFSRKIMLITH